MNPVSPTSTLLIDPLPKRQKISHTISLSFADLVDDVINLIFLKSSELNRESNKKKKEDFFLCKAIKDMNQEESEQLDKILIAINSSFSEIQAVLSNEQQISSEISSSMKSYLLQKVALESGFDPLLRVCKTWHTLVAPLKKIWVESNHTSLLTYNCSTFQHVNSCINSMKLTSVNISYLTLRQADLDVFLASSRSLIFFQIQVQGVTFFNLDLLPKLETLSVFADCPFQIGLSSTHSSLKSLRIEMERDTSEYFNLTKLINTTPCLKKIVVSVLEKDESLFLDAVARSFVSHLTLEHVTSVKNVLNTAKKMFQLKALDLSSYVVSQRDICQIFQSFPNLEYLYIVVQELWTVKEEEIAELLFKFLPKLQHLILEEDDGSPCYFERKTPSPEDAMVIDSHEEESDRQVKNKDFVEMDAKKGGELLSIWHLPV